jgi:hypothetical protein
MARQLKEQLNVKHITQNSPTSWQHADKYNVWVALSNTAAEKKDAAM